MAATGVVRGTVAHCSSLRREESKEWEKHLSGFSAFPQQILVTGRQVTQDTLSVTSIGTRHFCMCGDC